MVGSRLGESLVALLDRMNIYRPDKLQNREDLLDYLDSQKYSDLRECPDHSLAILQLAEKYEIRDLWIDAFAHCTGMNDTLIFSGELEVTMYGIQLLLLLTGDIDYFIHFQSADHESLLGNELTLRARRQIACGFHGRRPIEGISRSGP